MKFFILLFLLMSCGGNSGGSSEVSIANLNSHYNIPGLAGGLYQNDKFVALSAYGVRKSGHESLLTPQDKFHLGSCTKAMTATLAGILIEEGKLSWTSTLGELLPDVLMNAAYVTMSFETLLVHRAGFPVEHNVVNEVRRMDSVSGRKYIAEKILATPPLSAPGSRYQYSNYSYIIAGFILEKVSGESWETLMKRYIFDPLEMKTCGFGTTSLPLEFVPTQTWGHELSSGIPVPVHFDNPPAFGPASTVHCSLEDWGKFLALQVEGYNGESNLVTASTYRKLHSPHPARDSEYTYGGWYLLPRSWANGPTLSHAGSNTLNYAKVWLAPKRNSFIVSTANIGGEQAFFATDAFIQELIRSYLH